MMVLERVLENRISCQLSIDNMQFGIMPDKGTTDAIFIMQQEKYHARKKLYYAFVDLEKAFDRWATNDTVYKRWGCKDTVYKGWSSKRHSLQAVELSQRLQTVVQIVPNHPTPSNRGIFTGFWASRPYRPAAPYKSKGCRYKSRSGKQTQTWICDICHKQIHNRKQISIRCNRIEHWVHLRYAVIRQAQYTDTWTCHLHR